MTAPLTHLQMRHLTKFKLVLAVALVGSLSGCSSLGVGIGVPLGPFSIGVGAGRGGVSAGVGTGMGPVGVGVGVNQRGQVTGGAGVGVSTGVGGGASVGAGVGTGAVLYDPQGQSVPRSAVQPVPQPGVVGLPSGTPEPLRN